MVDNYPGNSKKQRAEETPSKDEVRPQLKKVVKGVGTVRKPSVGSRVKETFVGEDARTTGAYIFFDVIIPSIKSMLYDTISQGADRMLFGGRDVIRSGVANAQSRTRTNYNQISTQKASQSSANRGREVSSNVRTNHKFDEISIDTRGEAEMVLDTMQDLISRFDWVSVPEFYQLVGVTAEFTDEKWGWTNLSQASIRPSRGQYIIVLPAPEYDA
jgi:hypothetical protein